MKFKNYILFCLLFFTSFFLQAAVNDDFSYIGEVRTLDTSDPNVLERMKEIVLSAHKTSYNR